MKELVEYMAKSLVNNPDAVCVTERVNEQGEPSLLLNVAPEDMGKVIGRQGRIAKAMRMVLKAACAKDNTKITLEIE